MNSILELVRSLIGQAPVDKPYYEYLIAGLILLMVFWFFNKILLKIIDWLC